MFITELPDVAFILAVIGVSLIMAGLITVMTNPFGAFPRFVRRSLGLHVWHYRNPFDRTCEGCGRHQVEHQSAANPHANWWETFGEGNGKLMVCKPEKSKMVSKV